MYSGVTYLTNLTEWLIVKKSNLLQLSPEIHDSEIARLAPLLSPLELEMVALQHFHVLKAEVDSLKAEKIHDIEGFKRGLLTQFRNRTGSTRKVMFSAVLILPKNAIDHFVSFLFGFFKLHKHMNLTLIVLNISTRAQNYLSKKIENYIYHSSKIFVEPFSDFCKLIP